MPAHEPSPPLEDVPHAAIIRPRQGLRMGAVRMVNIEPPRPDAPEPSATEVAVQGVLPLGDLTGVLATPVHPTIAKQSRQRRSTPRYTEEELAQMTRHVCSGFVEVVYGNRAVNQLLRMTSERVYLELSRRSAQEKGRQRIATQRVTHARLERMRIQQPSPRAVEAFGRLRRGDEFHAIAARFELRRDRWMCVALEMQP